MKNEVRSRKQRDELWIEVLCIMEERARITSFTKLNAWIEGHKLVLMTYRVTKTFPKDELFGLVSQIRRCVVSITSNIAEGFSRNSWKEKLSFYTIALGSLTEYQNQLLVGRDVGYVTAQQFQEMAQQSITVSKLMNGLIKKSKSMIHNT